MTTIRGNLSARPRFLSKLPLLLLLTNIAGAVEAPVFAPAASQASTQFNVVVTCGTPGAEIHYSVNGTNPTLDDPSVASGSYVVIPRTVTLKAIAWSGGVASAVTSANYKVVGQLAAGDYHGAALKSNKALYAWGLNTYGALGDGTTVSQRTYPGFVKRSASLNFLDAIEVAAGARHTLALVESGGVMGFGLNTSAQLGNNSTTTPTDNLPRWVLKSATANDYLVNCFSVSAASDYSAALVGTSIFNGTVYTWGGNVNGRLGRIVSGSGNMFAKPVQTAVSPYPSLTGIAQIATGANHMMARTPHSSEQVGGLGQVWVWGLNSSGQLCLGNTTDFTRATQTTKFINITDISAGTAHSAAVKWSANVSGKVYCAGQQQHGRLGNNQTTSAVVSSPGAVQKATGDLEQIVAVAAGPRHTLALDSSGKVWAWGDNGSGELGDNTLTTRGFAAKVKNPAGTGDLSNIVNIAAGGPNGDGFSLASAADGTIYAWGANTNGKLGIGNTTTPKKLPVVVGTLKLTNQGSPSVELTATMPQTYEPAVVTLNADITDADGLNDIMKVEFYEGSILLETDTSAPYSINWLDVQAGSHTFSAVATDISGTQGSDDIVVEVRPFVSVETLTATAPEGSVAMPMFRISRQSANPNPQLVTFAISGTAVNGRDYDTFPNAVEIPANQTFVDLAVTGRFDYLVEPAETIIITLPDTTSQFPDPAKTSATAAITDVLRSDNDGLNATQEAALGTSPVMDDTDGDGVNDNLDAFPTDPDRSEAPAPTAGDTSPPTVTIQTPAGAAKVSGP